MTSSEYILYITVDESAADISTYNFTIMYPPYENAGIDLCAAESWKSSPGDPVHLLDLGVRAMLVKKDTGIPVNYWLLPRSSIFKTGHAMGNSVGVIDSSYRGVLKAPVFAHQTAASGFERGNRYFQIVAPDMGYIGEVHRVKSLPTTERGNGGFGSTGN
jgi:deoxyuridine 5'-triphosphate nucleotidohydrolase